MNPLVRRLVPGLILVGLVSLVFPAFLRGQDDADKIYKKNCVLCHAADGSGGSPSGKALGAKDLRSELVQKETDAELANFITQGKGKMPAFGKKLKPEDIKQLVAFIRALPQKK
jgi:mono/diheme cytochrome c family protein